MYLVVDTFLCSLDFGCLVCCKKENFLDEFSVQAVSSPDSVNPLIGSVRGRERDCISGSVWTVEIWGVLTQGSHISLPHPWQVKPLSGKVVLGM